MPSPLPRAEADADVLADPDSLRELVHEIKTPLNAIIGFAEIIEGQYLGPADRGYRERAAEIVGQARLLLTAIDDLDFAAKVHSREPRQANARRPWRACSSALAAELRELRPQARRRVRLSARDARLPRRSSRSSPSGCCSACSQRDDRARRSRRAARGCRSSSARWHCRVSISPAGALRGLTRRAIVRSRARAEPAKAGSRSACRCAWRGALARIAGGDLRDFATGLTLPLSSCADLARAAAAAIAASRGGPVAQR